MNSVSKTDSVNPYKFWLHFHYFSAAANFELVEKYLLQIWC